jgi:outer membrane protein assembly factor BamB
MNRRVAVLAVVLATVLGACDWTMVGFGPRHTGWNFGESTIDIANVGTLTESWTASIPRSTTNESQPVVAGGVLYAGSNDGNVYAFDADGDTNCTGTPKTCQPLWSAATGAPVTTTPAVVAGTLYVASRGALSAFDAADDTNCSGTPKTCAPRWSAGDAARRSWPTARSTCGAGMGSSPTTPTA